MGSPIKQRKHSLLIHDIEQTIQILEAQIDRPETGLSSEPIDYFTGLSLTHPAFGQAELVRWKDLSRLQQRQNAKQKSVGLDSLRHFPSNCESLDTSASGPQSVAAVRSGSRAKMCG